MGAFNDIRVLELGHVVAGPFAGSLMGDFGAEVIKVEKPGVGDSLRHMGPKDGPDSLWWTVAGRNKKSVAIDLSSQQGQDLCRHLVAESDVVIENFRPGTLDRWGIGWESLKSINNQLIMLRISGFGQTGEYSNRPGFGKIAEAFSGATNLTGHPSMPPVQPGYSLGDLTCGLMGAYAIAMALHARDTRGVGDVIDLALYEPLFRMIEWQLPLAQAGLGIERNGNKFPFQGAFIVDICETKDECNLVISAASKAMLERLTRLLIADGVVADEESDQSIMEEGLRAWVGERSLEHASDELSTAGIVSWPVFGPVELMNDPHIKSRGNVVRVKTWNGGMVAMPDVVPSMSTSPGRVKWSGPSLGFHTDSVLAEVLKLGTEEIHGLRASGIIG